jgi:hypothetical protein
LSRQKIKDIFRRWNFAATRTNPVTGLESTTDTTVVIFGRRRMADMVALELETKFDGARISPIAREEVSKETCQQVMGMQHELRIVSKAHELMIESGLFKETDLQAAFISARQAVYGETHPDDEKIPTVISETAAIETNSAEVSDAS